MSLVNLVPKDIFKEVVESLKKEIAITSITQSNGETTITCDTITNRINSNNYILFDCGDLKGYYIVKKVCSNKFVIDYSGTYTNGKIYTYPYFDWGNLKDAKRDVNKLNEFPLIFLVLPRPYELNSDKKVQELISGDFDFLVIDKITVPNGTKKTITEDNYDSTVSRMSNLALDFIDSVSNNKYILRDSTFTRSEEIPFGVTFSGDNGSDETFVQDCAGCYVKASVKIKKIYNC